MSRSVKIVLGLISTGVAGLIVLVIIGNVLTDHTNPPVTYDRIQWDSQQTEDLMRAACYDCHSNETVWPWYSFVAPASLLVGDHVEEGRDHLNFSTGHGELETRELIHEIEKGEMPPASYIILHPEANLSDQQKEDLIAGIRASKLR